MKNIFFIFILLSFCVPGLVFSQAKVVKLCSDPFPPHVIGTLGSISTEGFSTLLAKKVFERLEGYTVEVHVTPWNFCLKAMEEGQMDGSLSVVFNLERAAYLETSDSYYTDRGVWYYSKANFPNGFDWKAVADFKDKRVVLIQGSSYSFHKDLQAGIDNKIFKIHLVKNETLAMKQIVEGQQDFFPAPDLVGDQIVKDNGMMGKVEKAKKALAFNHRRFALSKKSPHLSLLPQINQIINDLREEGVTAQLAKEKL